MKFERIPVDPNQMGGVPCIRRRRIPVATIADMVADGMTESEILESYPDLEPDDFHEAYSLPQMQWEPELPLASP